MVYVEITEIEPRIPSAFLIQGLDDDNDGEIDAWDAVAEQASREVDGYISVRFALPLDTPLPEVVKLAAQTFACEMIYRRRGVQNEQNPYFAAGESMRTTLRSIASGKTPLMPGVERASASGTLISEPAPTHSASGRRMT